jgi:hypothetical protein
MAWTPNGANDAFNQGQFHTVNPGRPNSFSLTLGDADSSADQGLDDTSARWNDAVGQGYEPHSILAGLPGMSGNGMSAADAGRVLPGGAQLPAPDGTSAGTYQQTSTLGVLFGTD